MLIQYNLTSSVIYAQVENTNNASCVFFHMGDICPIKQELIRNHYGGMIKCIFKLIQNRKLTRNMISCIFQLNCKANAANLKWNSIFVQSIQWESVYLSRECTL